MSGKTWQLQYLKPVTTALKCYFEEAPPFDQQRVNTAAERE